MKPKGTFVWKHLNDFPETPVQLEFAIFDPELPLFGDGEGPSNGGIDPFSTYWAGSAPNEPIPFSLSQGKTYSLPEGGADGIWSLMAYLPVLRQKY